MPGSSLRSAAIGPLSPFPLNPDRPATTGNQSRLDSERLFHQQCNMLYHHAIDTIVADACGLDRPAASYDDRDTQSHLLPSDLHVQSPLAGSVRTVDEQSVRTASSTKEPDIGLMAQSTPLSCSKPRTIFLMHMINFPLLASVPVWSLCEARSKHCKLRLARLHGIGPIGPS